jgi:NAD dependent epimerase/dehydratase
MELAGKRVLVTGAGGFVGSHLCEELVRSGADVTAMIRYTSSSNWGCLEYLRREVKSEIRVEAGNVEDSDFVLRRLEGQDVVFHLAALIAIPYSYVAPKSYVRTNIEGTLNVLEAARRLEIERVVHTSTSETYGTAIYTPIDENHPLQGQSPYSASKIAADKLAESYYRSFGLPVATIRPFNTFGPRQSARAVIPTIITQALTQPEIKLGSLSPIRDLTYVKDTVRGFLATGRSDKAIGKVTNIGAGKGISIGDLAEQILGLMGVDKPISSDAQRIRPEQSEVLELLCDNSRALADIGWQPTVSLREGLLETIDFIEEFIDQYRPEVYTL